VYGREFLAPAQESSAYTICANHISSADYYAIARLNAEAKHRAFKNLNIVDIRIFSYFSRFIDLDQGYFITELLGALLNKKTLMANSINFVRDYIHPQDLYSLITKCIAAGKLNLALDAGSAKPVEKKEILDYFSAQYGLKCQLSESIGPASATGEKKIYCSDYKNAAQIGYSAQFSSLEALQQEAKYILQGSGKG